MWPSCGSLELTILLNRALSSENRAKMKEGGN